MKLKPIAVLALVTVLVASCGDDDDAAGGSGGEGPSTGGSASSLTLGLDFAVDGVHAPFFVAQEKDYFTEAGVDVAIEPGRGSADALKLVAAGRSDLAIVDASTVVTGIAEGAEVTAVGVLLRQMPGVTVVKSDSGIEAPSDLEDMSIGDAQQASTGVLLPAFLAANDLDADSVEFVGMAFEARVPSLESGQVDAIGGYAQEFVSILDDATLIPWFENGIDAYGSVIVVNNGFLEEDADAVEGFLEASARGLEDAMADPAEAAELTAADGRGDAGYFEGELELLVPYFADDEGTGLSMTERRWTSTQDLMLEYGGQESEVEVTTLFTNDHLPE